MINRAVSHNRRVRWNCLCACGESVIITADSLRSGSTKSCGCLVRELSREASTTHGKSKHPLYSIHKNMVYRCTMEHTPQYINYGGRGIKVCEEWSLPGGVGLINFITDMYPTHLPGLELDRKDNNLGYSKDNCRWVTSSQNNMNTRARKNTSSKYKGVWRDSVRRMWVAELRLDGKRCFRGHFDNEVSAAKKYNEKALELFGEFASLNILDE